MKFFEDGPDLPHELLTARDEGRLVIFCGSGVSRAKSHLPDFFGLAQKVINRLGVPANDRSRQILRQIAALGKDSTIKPLIPLDRVFGAIETEYKSHLNRAVAETLDPTEVARSRNPNDVSVDISAHEILIDLARSSDGSIKIVTTNFDRLFEKVDNSIVTVIPPTLPNLINEKFDALVYLHGRTTDKYDGAEGHGFVLTTSEFGRAYLTEGWATRFVKQLVERYSLLFIGYAADDPPVQYILEALKQSNNDEQKAYAFQVGDSEDDVNSWKSKGVEAITYAETELHEALWNTLSSWANRARNPEMWRQEIARMAQNRPETLKPFERSQIAHLVSTLEGAKIFADIEPPPSPEWLCVFDKKIRYGNPAKVRREDLTLGERVDPFHRFQLDTDTPIRRKEENGEDLIVIEEKEKRKIIDAAWSAFENTRIDMFPVKPHQFQQFLGSSWATERPLSKRQNHLARWIGKTCNSHTAIWWASKQAGLHPSIQKEVENELNNDSGHAQAWRYLMNDWSANKPDPMFAQHSLRDVITREGWTLQNARIFIEHTRPYISNQHYQIHSPIPPEHGLEDDAIGLLSLEIVYPKFPADLPIEDEFYSILCEGLRRNLLEAEQLERELAPRWVNQIDNLSTEVEDNESIYGGNLYGTLRGFRDFFIELARIDPNLARKEFESWSVSNSSIFSRLSIWASSLLEVISNQLFIDSISKIDTEHLWSAQVQTDLLITLRARWADLSEENRKHIEEILLKGPDGPWEGEPQDQFEVRKSWRILNMITWLNYHGCGFSFDVEDKIQELSKNAPEWKREYGENVTSDQVSGPFWVQVDKDMGALANAPIEQVLEMAESLGGRSSHYKISKKPFTGLSEKLPQKAFDTLIYEGNNGNFPEKYWQTFLESEARSEDSADFVISIGEKMLSYLPALSVRVSRSLASWFRITGIRLLAANEWLFDELFMKLTEKLISEPEICRSGVSLVGNRRDWTTESINSPAGMLADLLFYDSRISGPTTESIPASWFEKASRLLSLEGDGGRYVLERFSVRLGWLFRGSSEWTTENVLVALDTGDKSDQSAFWAGLLRSPSGIPTGLFLFLIPYVIERVRSIGYNNSPEIEGLAGMLLGAWLRSKNTPRDTIINSDEFRAVLNDSVERIRYHVLWQFKAISDKEFEGVKPSTHLNDFLVNVWPLSETIKNSEISEALADLAFKNQAELPQITNALIPLLSPIEDEKHIGFYSLNDKNGPCDTNPREVLSILHACLSKDVRFWPYDFGTTLEMMVVAAPKIAEDPKYIELKRLWDAR